MRGRHHFLRGSLEVEDVERVRGLRQVALLDGGLAKWKAEGRRLESGGVQSRRGHFTPVLDEPAVADKAYVASIVHSDGHDIVDARPRGRFTGEEPEPRPGLEPGHIPGSRNLPQSEFFNPDNSWKRDAALREAFDGAGIDLSKPMVTTCGSGITAAVVLFAAHLLGKQDVKLYDGSWSEWGSDPSTPKARGGE